VIYIWFIGGGGDDVKTNMLTQPSGEHLVKEKRKTQLSWGNDCGK
jgi:hypothetical protein